MSIDSFHPVVQDWFSSRFRGPTEPQQRGWPAIAAGGHTLISAPTGSGKTLTAFLAIIDRLFREGTEGRLADEMRIVYVSPLRALSNDMHRNLEEPLAEITAEAERQGLVVPPITIGLRTGDTSSYQRQKLVKRPPHIFVTTPESLYLMLTAEKSREVLRSVDTLIVDEIHALVRDKRGSHLALTMERLEHLAQRPLQRIGISATQKPIERMAQFLVGSETRFPQETGFPHAMGNRVSEGNPVSATIIDVGHQRDLDLGIEVPPSDLSAVCSHEQWAEVNARLVELINEHRSTLIFVNTRRLAERVTHQLAELLGEDHVGSHHGSLAADIRLDTEQKLKTGQLKAVVATASLELGIDVGYIDLVVQLGSPRSIATFLQRIGRSGHALGLTPKGRLFALTRDELLECMALVRAVKAGRLDVTPIPEAPLDILAQQIVAEVAAGSSDRSRSHKASENAQNPHRSRSRKTSENAENPNSCESGNDGWNTDDLFDLVRRAYPYRDLSRQDFDRTIHYLSEGITDTAGRTRTFLHHDQVNRRLRPRKAARLAAISNGGAIGETDTIRVVLEPEHTVVGSVDEEFGVESMAGDVFLLGNTSWRIQQLRGNDLVVTDAHGAPPTIPFWRGEAPGRTIELSEEVSRLREEIRERLTSADTAAVENWLAGETNCSAHAARQIVEYVAAQQAAVGLVPTQTQVVFERFFDESGGMQLVVHAPFGGRINRAWGLAMRKRFCRSYDFELQASADDDGFILSLGPQHSFPIESLFPMLRTDNVKSLLEQALLAVPMFHLRWRWNVQRSLIVSRMRNGKKVPPAIQRFRSEDMLTAVFPKLTGCQEEHTGDHEIPDHPLVQQTMHDCLTEALDLEGLLEILGRVERGEITFVARDTREPSPFAYELLNANPYAFLDGGEVQERRARAVETRRSISVESVHDLGRLDPEAIGQVVAEAQPLVRDADELHDVLLSRILLVIPESEDACGFAGSLQSTAKLQADCVEWIDQYRLLEESGRATTFINTDGRPAWVAAERLPAARLIWPEAACEPPIEAPAGVRDDWTAVDARVAAVRGAMEVAGPVTAADVAALVGITCEQANAALEALEGEGVVLRGQFTPDDEGSTGFQPVREDLVDESPAPDAKREGTHGLETRATNSHPASRNTDRDVEWCHRRLLARIHRLTVAGLRKQIEPVDVPTFVRFLTRLHGLTGDAKATGTNGLFKTIGRLQGLDIPAAAWEEQILARRVAGYQPAWLDELCLTGEIGWGRLYPPPRDPERARPMTSITRLAPVSLFLREDLDWLLETARDADEASLSSPAAQVLEILKRRGALFATDVLAETRLLPAELDEVIGELVARGFLTADGFAGLRKITRTDSDEEPSRKSRRRSRSVTRRRSASGVGRWSLWRPQANREGEAPAEPEERSTGFQPVRAAPASGTHGLETRATTGRADERARRRDVVEEWAWQLLRRWGVVFRDLLTKEAGAPPWWELVQIYRRLEARGEIRGGRFVSGVAGEQFALGESIGQLRRLRDEGLSKGDELLTISAADPLNLVGVLTPHARLASRPSNALILLNGKPVARIESGELTLAPTCPSSWRERVQEHAAAATHAAVSDDSEFTDRHARRFERRRQNGRRQESPGGIPKPLV